MITLLFISNTRRITRRATIAEKAKEMVRITLTPLSSSAKQMTLFSRPSVYH